MYRCTISFVLFYFFVFCARGMGGSGRNKRFRLEHAYDFDRLVFSFAGFWRLRFLRIKAARAQPTLDLKFGGRVLNTPLLQLNS